MTSASGICSSSPLWLARERDSELERVRRGERERCYRQWMPWNMVKMARCGLNLRCSDPSLPFFLTLCFLAISSFFWVSLSTGLEKEKKRVRKLTHKILRGREIVLVAPLSDTAKVEDEEEREEDDGTGHSKGDLPTGRQPTSAPEQRTRRQRWHSTEPHIPRQTVHQFTNFTHM